MRRSVRRSHRAYAAGALLAASGLAAGCAGGDPSGEEGPTVLGGAVSAATEGAAEAGLAVLSAGGNAVDASAAVSIALGVTLPSRAGIGASALLLVRTAAGDVHVLRGAPAPEGDTVRSADLLTVLDVALERFGSGRVEWEALVRPARRLAEGGFVLGRAEHRARVRNADRIAGDPELAGLLLREDLSIPTERSTVRATALAGTLEALERGGISDFPGSDVGEDLTEAGLTYAGDVRVEEPRRGTYRDWTVWTVPDSGPGERLLRALELLATAPPEVLEGPGVARTLWLAEALTFAAGEAGDPAAWASGRPPLPSTPTPVPGAAATDTATRAPVGRTQRPPPERIAPTRPPGAGVSATTAFAVLDGAGAMVVGLLTLGEEYGAGTAAPGTGVVLPSARAAADRPWGGAGLLLLRGDTLPGLAAGASGGSSGEALAQIVAGWADAGLPLEQTAHLPRAQVEVDTARGARIFLEGVRWSPGILEETRWRAETPDSVAWVPTADTLTEERGRFREFWGFGVRPALVERGYLLGEWPARDANRLDRRFGIVHAVAAVDPMQGWEAVADRREEGASRSLSPEEAAARAP